MRTLHDEDGREAAAAGETWLGCKAITGTPLALKVRFRSGRAHWLPRSALHDNSEVFAEGHEGKLVLKGWFAKNIREPK